MAPAMVDTMMKTLSSTAALHPLVVAALPARLLPLAPTPTAMNLTLLRKRSITIGGRQNGAILEKGTTALRKTGRLWMCRQERNG